jgi:exonuclease III
VQEESGKGSKYSKPGCSTRSRITSFNIQSGHGVASWNLQAIAWDAKKMQMDIVFVQETKLMNKMYSKTILNFDFVASETSLNNKGGVVVFIWRSDD